MMFHEEKWRLLSATSLSKHQLQTISKISIAHVDWLISCCNAVLVRMCTLGIRLLHSPANKISRDVMQSRAGICIGCILKCQFCQD